MKTTQLFLCLTLGLCSAAPAAELLWNNFDSAPTGSVATQPGWTRANWLGTTTGNIVSLGAYYSPSNTLELPWSASGSAAVYTNFSTTYTTAQHPVIRFSAKLETGNSNIFFQLGLRNSSTSNFLSFQSTNGQGVVGFQTRNQISVPLLISRFTDVTIFYNRSNGQVRLDYNLTNRLAWTNSDVFPTIHTQFNQFVVTRLLNTVDTTGRLFIDDVSVETFPPHVWAWWRCAAIPTLHFVEQLGTFPTTRREIIGDSARAGSTDPIWDGQGDAHNTGATRGLAANPTNCALTLPPSTNWTVETVFLMPTNSGNSSFLDWGTRYGFDTNGAWISIGYNTNGYIYANLRDSQQGDAIYTQIALRQFTPNGRWQHLAVVKSNANLALYVDYQLVTNRTLIAPTLGAYAFGTNSRATLGQSLNGGNISDANTLIDEVRVSGKALALSEFIQPSRPLIVAINNSATNTTWELTMKGILTKSYRVETSSAFGSNANWQTLPGSAFTAAHTFTFVDLTNTVPRTNFVRLIRTN